MFCTSIGTPESPSNLRKRSFVRSGEKAGLPRCGSMTSGHTCATVLLAQGVHPKVVQEQLGHSADFPYA